MPFSIIRDDLSRVQADAIVNTANPQPVIGAGTDAAIHAKAGPRLLAFRQQIGPLAPGQCALSPAFDLSARYVIHTVGPVWQDGTCGEAEVLYRCYEEAMRLAVQHRCASVAFPLISSGTYGFPKALALQTALRAIGAFLMEHELTVLLVVYDLQAFRLSARLLYDVESYIDENYVARRRPSNDDVRRRRDAAAQALPRCSAVEADRLALPCGDAADFTFETEAGFTETLLELIDRSGEKDSSVYKRANITRQHFSKIRSDLHYRPSKTTALAFAVALQLDLPQTRDLLGRAGYAMTRSSLGDVIVQHFIELGNYDLLSINTCLFEHGQPQLGS